MDEKEKASSSDAKERSSSSAKRKHHSKDDRHHKRPKPGSDKHAERSSSSHGGSHSRSREKHDDKRRKREQKPPSEAVKQSVQSLIPGLDEAPSAAIKSKPKSQFWITLQYHNDLPEVPTEPKFLKYPHDENRLTRYCCAGLDKKRKFDLLTESDLGIPIDLIDVKQYERPKGVQEGEFEPEDEPLMTTASEQSKNAKLRPTVTWLRKSAILSNDLEVTSTFGNVPEIVDARGRIMDEEEKKFDSSEEAQIAAIQTTFSAATETPIHPRNPKLQAVKIQSVFPDDVIISNKYCLTTFVEAPAVEIQRRLRTGARDAEAGLKAGDLVKDSLLSRRAADHIGFYAQHLYEKPTAADSDAPPKFDWVREYAVKPIVSARDNLFFIMSDDAVRYGRFDTNLQLRRKMVEHNDEASTIVLHVGAAPMSDDEDENTPATKAARASSPTVQDTTSASQKQPSPSPNSSGSSPASPAETATTTAAATAKSAASTTTSSGAAEPPPKPRIATSQVVSDRSVYEREGDDDDAPSTTKQ